MLHTIELFVDSAEAEGMMRSAEDVTQLVTCRPQASVSSRLGQGSDARDLDLLEPTAVARGTRVYVPDTGIYHTVEELAAEGNFSILSLHPGSWKLVPRSASGVCRIGRQSVYSLTTQLGHRVRATAQVSVLTIGGLRPLADVEPGAHIALPRQLPDVSPDRACPAARTSDQIHTTARCAVARDICRYSPANRWMRPEELALLGHLIGNGCTLPRHVVQYTTRDKDVGKLVIDLAHTLFPGRIAGRMVPIPGQRCFEVYLPSATSLTHGVHNPIADWLRDLSIFGLRSHEKYVPQPVFGQPTALIAHFLRHLWTTDGTATLGSGPAIRYATSSQQLAWDVQALLLRLGITARVTRVPQGTKGRDQYHVSISGKADQLRFFTEIGVEGVRKRAMLLQCTQYLLWRQENTNRDVIPREVWGMLILPALRQQSLTYRDLAERLGVAYNGTARLRHNLSRTFAARVARAGGISELEALAVSNVYWDRVVAVEPVGVEEVYVLMGEPGLNFVAENVLIACGSHRATRNRVPRL